MDKKNDFLPSKNLENCLSARQKSRGKCEKVLKFCEQKMSQKASKKGEHDPNLLETW
jgi:hypothetical protein